MRHVIDSYLEAKYSVGGPGSSRFDPVDDEVHASQISDCQRKRKWKHDRGHRAGASPYFELGRVFEVLYGAALAFEHDPGVTADTLKSHPPWEVVEITDRVVQDVNVDIDIGGGSIVGECDWVVFTERAPRNVSEVRVDADGGRTAVLGSGEELPYDPDWTNKVVETKTKKDVEWVARKGPDDSHVYQVYPYMHALDSDGEIAYMERNDWGEYVVELEYDPDRWLDCVVRARQHARNQSDEDGATPPTTPLDSDECHWCPYSDECKSVGGSQWS